MSGHSHWAGIKHKKTLNDAKKSRLFSKLLIAISIAAKEEPNPQFNPRLRSAVEKAREASVPQDNIERAIKRANEAKDVEEITLEAYGPEGVAIIIEAVTDNRNRTIAEIKKILGDHNAKLAAPGSVLWTFQKTDTREWEPKFFQALSPNTQKQIEELLEIIDDHPDVQNVYENIKI